MRKKMLVFGQPLISDEEINEVVDSLKNAWLGTGPKVQQFEKDFSSYKGADYCAAVNSCTAALHLACLALDLKPKDEVITTANTFCATVNAIILSGATPVVADINPLTLNIDPEQIKRRITKRTKAVLVVHFAGRPCEMDAITDIVREHNLALIEDCAHAIESEYHGRKVGLFGDFGCFSFYVTKNITTGEGGMVVGRNRELIDKIRRMALHGMSNDAWKRFSDTGYKHYYVLDKGFKYNMMDLQAAIGIHQLKRIEQYRQRREEIWNKYVRVFKSVEIGLPPHIEPATKHAYHLFTIRIDSRKIGITRDQFLDELTKRNIGVGVHYLAIPEHPYYRKEIGLKSSDCPYAMDYGQQTISLPLSAKLTDNDVEDVIGAVLDVISTAK
jgi:dTDP-4-amino-4,6-dideoxygalactose transaminase